MKVRVGDILDQYADFPDKDLYLMSRYIVLNTEGANVKLYVMKGYRMEGLVNKQGPVVVADFNHPGDIEEVGHKYIVSKKESTNNFYYEVISAI
tara:strand:+ start:8736 stop:9017 length:282 start_codon:yes stop_codon:yes gene_type:complete